MKITPCDWDSKYFNKSVGAVSLTSQIPFGLEPSSYDLLYVRSSSPFNLEIPSFSETYAEVKIIYSKNNLQRNDNASLPMHSFSELNMEPSALYELAYESGKYSRFNLDAHFTTSDFKTLYTQWVDASVAGTWAKDVLVALRDSEVVGFVTYQVHDDIGQIGLIGVAPAHQGSGIGSTLIKSVENELVEQGVFSLNIPTQRNNEAACVFYEKMGYTKREEVHIKHFWKL